jgi:phenylacetate-CoA ligase
MGATTMAEVGVSTAPGARGFFDREVETLPREALAALQAERLRHTVRDACAHVPVHRARLAAAGIEPEDLRGVEDIERLPFTTKSDLRDGYPFGLFARPVPQLARLHASSGTTGKPTVVGYTRRDLDTWADLMARSLVSAHTATGSSPADSARTTAPSAWARSSCRCPGARPRSRSR